MYAIIQTRFKPIDTDKSNHNFGIISKGQSYRNRLETLHSITYNDIVPELKKLERWEFSDVNVGFYLILE
jgi:hypothetical protein